MWEWRRPAARKKWRQQIRRQSKHCQGPFSLRRRLPRHSRCNSIPWMCPSTLPPWCRFRRPAVRDLHAEIFRRPKIRPDSQTPTRVPTLSNKSTKKKTNTKSPRPMLNAARKSSFRNVPSGCGHEKTCVGKVVRPSGIPSNAMTAMPIKSAPDPLCVPSGWRSKPVRMQPSELADRKFFPVRRKWPRWPQLIWRFACPRMR